MFGACNGCAIMMAQQLYKDPYNPKDYPLVLLHIFCQPCNVKVTAKGRPAAIARDWDCSVEPRGISTELFSLNSTRSATRDTAKSGLQQRKHARAEAQERKYHRPPQQKGRHCKLHQSRYRQSHHPRYPRLMGPDPRYPPPPKLMQATIADAEADTLQHLHQVSPSPP